jgi:predicted phage tail protein
MRLIAIQQSQIEMAETATEIRIFRQLLQNKKVRMLIENILGVGSITGILATAGYASAVASIALPVVPVALGAVVLLMGVTTFLDELIKRR